MSVPWGRGRLCTAPTARCDRELKKQNSRIMIHFMHSRLRAIPEVASTISNSIGYALKYSLSRGHISSPILIQSNPTIAERCNFSFSDFTELAQMENSEL